MTEEKFAMKICTWINLQFILILLPWLNVETVFSQTKTLDFDEILEFSNYLTENELYNDNILLLNNALNRIEEEDRRDTLKMRSAFSHYKLERGDSALYKLALIQTWALQISASVIERFIQLKIGERPYNKYLFECEGYIYPVYFDVMRTEMLISRDFDLYNKRMFGLASDQNEIGFDRYYEKYMAVKKKSPFLAGSLSAIIPGAGKIYAGKTGEGLSAFFSNAILGIQLYEHQKALGWKSVRTGIFAALFTTFYIGNIRGSALSVKIVKTEQYEALDHQLLLDVAVPLERFFRYGKQ